MWEVSPVPVVAWLRISGLMAIPRLLAQPWACGLKCHSVAIGHGESHSTAGPASRASPPSDNTEIRACQNAWSLIVQSWAQGCRASQQLREAHHSCSSAADQNWPPCLNNLLSKQPHKPGPEHCFIFGNNDILSSQKCQNGVLHFSLYVKWKGSMGGGWVQVRPLVGDVDMISGNYGEWDVLQWQSSPSGFKRPMSRSLWTLVW